jgi:2-C-methyl-D-erythritol 4-phosphate cytidylyltransferase
MKITAIIVAGGQGLRMKMPKRKQYLELDGLSVLAHTLKTFNACSMISDICLVIPYDDHDYCLNCIVQPLCLLKPLRLVSGGNERQQSVYNGLKSLVMTPDDIVVIHDGVRPFVTDQHITDCINTARECGAAILAVPVSDTLKMADDHGMVEKTLDRKSIWAAQTPQAFSFGLIWEAHEAAIRNHWMGTDDASLVEALGKKVRLVHGSRNNLKITTQEDVLLARNLLKDTELNNQEYL